MLKYLFEKIVNPRQEVKSDVSTEKYEKNFFYPKGEVFFTLTEEATGEVIEERHIQNVITKDLSILIARLCRDPLEPNHGIAGLAVGTGDPTWDLQNPPQATDTQRSLYDEIERKKFSAVVFRDPEGNVSPIPTKVLDFTAIFAGPEAVGPLVEMGLVGGDVSTPTCDFSEVNPILPANGPYNEYEDVREKDTLCNYLTFPVINKPNSAVLTLTWRLTF
jgi:hypothetical protein